LRYRGVGDDGTTRELNTVRVTHRKKRIIGVQATVVLDRVFSKGKPEERTFDWYAQDNEGNVWYLGEDSSNFELVTPALLERVNNRGSLTRNSRSFWHATS
jgi:hypothetical protein